MLIGVEILPLPMITYSMVSAKHKEKWVFQPHHKDYLHGQIGVQYHFDFSFELHGEDLDQIGKNRLLFYISRAFGG